MKMQRVGDAMRQLRQRPRYRREEFFAELGSILLRSADLPLLLRRAAQFIQRSLQIDQVMIAVQHQERYQLFATPGAHQPPMIDIYQLSRGACARRHGNAMVAIKDLDDATVRQSLQMVGVAWLLPLVAQGDCAGYILLGKRRGGYALRYRHMLEAASKELVIAIRNAQALDEVRVLNETLQQRIKDATKELRASNRQLQRLDEAKSEFISMASHQLRTPLTSIKGYLDMILEGDFGPVNATQRAVLSEAFSSSERMVQLIGDFLNVSRLQTGKFMIERRPTDITTLAHETVSLLRVVAKQRDVSIATHCDPDIPQLLLDTEKIRQVILNMIDNAIYYSRSQSTINVAVKREGRTVKFTVTDTGIGVPEAEQATLFTKFFRATNARKRRPDGTGVGLYLARKVIVGHGGTIIFASKEGEGSTFGFQLPITRLKQADNARNDDQ